MKSDVEKTIDVRVAAAFADIPMGSSAVEIVKCAQDLVKLLWTGKIYAMLPKDKTTIPEYFLDAELEQFLNEAIEECYEKMCLIAEQAKRQL
jgi:hypothetical protein